MIDSGVGLPIGQKISLKSFIQVDDENGGFITLQYKTLNFDLLQKHKYLHAPM